MRKYDFVLQEVLEKRISIVANSEEEARNQIYDKYYNKEITLTSSENFIDLAIVYTGVSDEVQESDLFIYICKVMDTDEYFQTKLFLGTEEDYKEFVSKSKFVFSEFTDFGKAPDEIVMLNGGEWELLPRDVAYKHLPSYVAENDILWSNM